MSIDANEVTRFIQHSGASVVEIEHYFAHVWRGGEIVGPGGAMPEGRVAMLSGLDRNVTTTSFVPAFLREYEGPKGRRRMRLSAERSSKPL